MSLKVMIKLKFFSFSDKLCTFLENFEHFLFCKMQFQLPFTNKFIFYKNTKNLIVGKQNDFQNRSYNGNSLHCKVEKLVPTKSFIFYKNTKNLIVGKQNDFQNRSYNGNSLHCKVEKLVATKNAPKQWTNPNPGTSEQETKGNSE